MKKAHVIVGVIIVVILINSYMMVYMLSHNDDSAMHTSFWKNLNIPTRYQKHGMGLKVEPSEMNDKEISELSSKDYDYLITHAPSYPGRRPVPMASPSGSAFPPAVNNTEYLPPVGNQGAQGSCVGWATTYYTYSYMLYWYMNRTHPSADEAMSPAFTYNQINYGTDSGSLFGDAASLIQNMGALPMREMPYNDADYVTWPSESQYVDAMHYRAAKWYYLYIGSGTGGEQNMTKLKYLLAAGYVAITGIVVYDDFYTISANDSNIYAVNQTHKKLEGYHAQTIIGYDDDLETPDGHGAFRIVNSWGAGWGDHGYYWLTYSAARSSELSEQYVWIIVPRANPSSYSPELISFLKISHAKRGEIIGGVEDSIPGGFPLSVAVNGSPVWSKRFFDFWMGYQSAQSELENYQAHPFPQTPIALDLTDSISNLSRYANSWEEPFYVTLKDKVKDGVTGTLQGFSFEVNSPYFHESVSSTDMPLSIPENGSSLNVSVNVPIVDYGNKTPANNTPIMSNQTTVDVGSLVNLTSVVVNWNGTNYTMERINPKYFVLNITNISYGAHTFRAYLTFENGNKTALPLRTVYYPHLIRINNNSELESLASTEGWQGDGSPQNPYILSNFSIDAHGTPYGIYIGNTSKYVIIKNGSVSGITIYTSFYYHATGIELYNTTNITVENVSVANSMFGVALMHSTDDYVYNCKNFTYLSIYGVEVLWSNNVTVANNTFERSSGNLSAIAVIRSEHNTLFNNQMTNNTIYVWGGRKTFTTEKISLNNSVNEQPVRYYVNVNMQNVVIPSHTAEVILGNVSNANISGLTGAMSVDAGYSSNLTVANNGIVNGKGAVYLEGIENATIVHNNCSGAMFGISGDNMTNIKVEFNQIYTTVFSDALYFNNTHFATIDDNHVYRANGEGLFMYNSDNISVENNAFSHNFYYGIYELQSSNCTIVNNTVVDNQYDNLLLYESRYSKISGNNMSGSLSSSGIHLMLSDENAVINNSLWHNTYGVNLWNSYRNNISENLVLRGEYGGIVMQESDYNSIFRNNISDSLKGDGIDMWSSNNNSLKENTVLANNVLGISMTQSSENEVRDNLVQNNSNDGMSIYNSTDDYIKNNSVLGNGANGIYMELTSSVTVSDNLLLENGGDGLKVSKSQRDSIISNFINRSRYSGIYLSGSDNCTIQMNVMSYSREYEGLILYLSDNNTVANNTIANNHDQGVYMQASSNNTISGNTIENNTNYGVELISGAHNVLYLNSFLFNHNSSGIYNASHVQAYDSGTNSTWNTTSEGNYWYDWANNNGTNDQKKPYGIVDWPYRIDGGANSEDHLPLKRDNAYVPEFSSAFAVFSLFSMAMLGVFWKKREKK